MFGGPPVGLLQHPALEEAALQSSWPLGPPCCPCSPRPLSSRLTAVSAPRPLEGIEVPPEAEIEKVLSFWSRSDGCPGVLALAQPSASLLPSTRQHLIYKSLTWLPKRLIASL